MIPTLKMFTTTVTTDPHYMDPICAEVQQFHQLGGTLLFGTDVGYMTDYTTEGEFVELGKSGLDWKTVLAMLTTNPAARMGVSDSKGTVTRGKLADLTILDADPADDLTNFSRVHAVVRSGQGGLAAIDGQTHRIARDRCPILILRFRRLPACRESCFYEDLSLSKNQKSVAANRPPHPLHHRHLRAAQRRGGDGRRRSGHDGDHVLKHSAKKIRRLYQEKILAGFAGSTADAFNLFTRFETKLEQYAGNLNRAAVELAKDWRTDKMLRNLEALLVVADKGQTFLISGSGDVIDPDEPIAAIGSGGSYATAAARALMENTDLDAHEIAAKAMKIAADICIYTNDRITFEELKG